MGGGGAACCFKSPFSSVLCLGRTHTSGMHLKTALSPEPIITWQVLEPTRFSHFSSVSSPSSLPLHPRVGISEPQPGNLTHLDSTHGSSTGEQWEEEHEKPQQRVHGLIQKTNANNALNLHRNVTLISLPLYLPMIKTPCFLLLTLYLPWSMIKAPCFPSRDSPGWWHLAGRMIWQNSMSKSAKMNI